MKTLKIPKWFYESGLNKVGYPAIDHIIAVRGLYGNKEVHSRPYHILQRQMEQVAVICRACNIGFLISGFTTYENRDTFIIKFWLKRERIEAEFLHNNPHFLNKSKGKQKNA